MAETETTIRPSPVVVPEIAGMTESLVFNDSYVYVHGHIARPASEMLVRIWKTTYLVDRISGNRSELVHVENISYAPQWTFVRNGKDYRFLLVFSSLPPSCIQFDLIEEISLSRGFFVPGIVRNARDVYHIDIA